MVDPRPKDLTLKLSTLHGCSTPATPRVRARTHAREAAVAVVLAVLFAAAALPVHAVAAAPAPDTTPMAVWQPNGPVNVIRPSADGHRAFIGGDFDYLGPATGASVRADAAASPAPTTTDWPRFSDGTVTAIIDDGLGGWFVGGDFQRANGVTDPWLVRVTPDGGVDSTWSASPIVNGRVSALERNGSTLYVAFGATTPQLVALDVNFGNLQVAFADDGIASVVGTAIHDLLATADRLYVAGAFSEVEGAMRNNLASLGHDGDIDNAFDPNVGGVVRSIDAFEDSPLYLAGDFVSVGDAPTIPRSRIAAVDRLTGEVDPTFDPGTGTASAIHAVAVDATGVYVGGEFTTFDGINRNRVARLAPTGAVDAAFNSETTGPLALDAPVRALALRGGSLHVAGSFTHVGTTVMRHHAVIDTGTNALDTAWRVEAGDPVTALATAGDDVVLGGGFTSAGGVSRSNLAAIDLTTGAATSWSLGVPNPVFALAEHEGILYVGGSGGVGNLVARSAKHGANVPGFVPRAVSGNASVVSALAVTSDRQLYVGGSFTQVDGAPRQNLTAIDLADDQLHAWTDGASGPVNDLEAVDGAVVVAGQFSMLRSSSSAAYLGRIEGSTGQLDAWYPGANSAVRSIAIDRAADRLYAAGSFTAIGGGSANYGVAGISYQTPSIGPWEVPVSPASSVDGIDVLDGRLLAAGSFTTLGLTGPSVVGGIVDGQTAADWSPTLPPSFTSARTIAASPRVTLVAGPVGLAAYRASGDTLQPFIGNVKVTQAQPGVDPSDSTHVDGTTVYVRTTAAAPPAFTVHARAFDTYQENGLGGYTRPSGLASVQWGAIDPDLGAWTPGTGSQGGARRGLRIDCWKSNDPGTGTYLGTDFDRNLGYDGSAGRQPDRWPALPAGIALAAGEAYDDTDAAHLASFRLLSCSWRGHLVAPADLVGATPFEFRTHGDNGMLLTLDGDVLVDEWNDSDPGLASDPSAPVDLAPDASFPIEVDWFENSGDARALVQWDDGSAGTTWKTIPDAAYVTEVDYERTYEFQSGSVVQGTPYPVSIEAIDHAGERRTTTFHVQVDNAPPTRVGSISTTPTMGSFTNDATPTVNLGGDADFIDASGVHDRVLQRRATTLSDGVCTPPVDGPTEPTEWQDVVTFTTAPIPTAHEELVPLATGCYQYRYLVRDNVGNVGVFEPAGQSGYGNWLKVDISGPDISGAAVTHHDGWFGEDQLTVSFVAPVDEESGIPSGDTRLIQKLGTVQAGGGCDMSSPTFIEMADPVSPVDVSVADGTCVTYRIATRNAAGVDDGVESGVFALVDRAVPVGSFDPQWASPPANVVVGTPTISGTHGDGALGSGTTGFRLAYVMPPAAEVDISCTTLLFSASAWGCDWNTGALVSGTYTLNLYLEDEAGNETTTPTTTQVIVDNDPPTISIDVDDSQAAVHDDGTTTWVRTTAAGSASYTLTVDGTGSQVSSLASGSPVGWPTTFPTMAPWAGGTISWDQDAATPPTWPITIEDEAGHLGTVLIPIKVDNVAPAGVTIDVPDVTQDELTVQLDVDPGDDEDRSGIASATIWRSAGALVNDTCSMGAFAPRDTVTVADAWQDAGLAHGTCYQYELRVADNVDNAVVADAPSSFVRVDVEAPTSTIDTHAAGDWVSGTITIEGTLDEPTTSVTSVDVTLGSAACTAMTIVADSYSCELDTTALGDGLQQLTVTATDAAGNTGTNTSTSLSVDNTAPVFDATIADVAGVAWSSGSTTYVRTSQPGPLTISTGANAGGGSPIQSVTFSAPGWSTTGPALAAPFQSSLDWTGAATDATLTATIVDEAGNEHQALRELVVDNDPPATGSWTIDVTGVAPVIDHAVAPDDPAGPVTIQLQREVTTIAGGSCDGSAWTNDLLLSPGAFPYQDSTGLLPDRCYRYVAVVSDQLAQQATLPIPGEFQSSGPGLVITPPAGGATSVTENGATATMGVALRSHPGTATVTVTVTADANARVDGASSVVLTFDSGNWSTAAPVVVSAVDDQLDQVASRQATVTWTTDTAYGSGSAITATTTHEVVDDDVPAIQLDVPAGGLALAEPGTSASYRVRLGSRPHGTVTIVPSASGGQVTLSTAALSFSGSDWNDWKEVVVTAVDDPDIEGAHGASITHGATLSDATADAGYAGVTVAAVPVAISDDDQHGLLVSPPSTTTLDEAGTTASTVTVSLRARPAGMIEVAVAATNGQAVASPAALTFEPATWNVAQTVTVRAVTDSVAEPSPHGERVQVTARSSTDPAWAAAAPAPFELAVTDDDPARLVKSPGLRWETDDDNRVLLDETATQGSILRIRAVGDPTRDVKITPQPAPDGQLVVTPEFQVIPAGSHEQAVAFSVRAVNDRVDETDVHAARIAWKVETADPMYGSATLATTFARVTDAPPTMLRETTGSGGEDDTGGGGGSTGGDSTTGGSGGAATGSSNPAPTGLPPTDRSTADETGPASQDPPGQTVGDDGGVDDRSDDAAGGDGDGAGAGAGDDDAERAKPEPEGNVVTRPMRKVKQWASENKGKAAAAASAGGTAAIWAAKPLALAGKALATGGGGGLPTPPGITQLRHLLKARGGRRVLRGARRRRWWGGKLRDLREEADDDDWDDFLWGNDRAA